MSYYRGMKTREQGAKKGSVELFPFLAVLICTMGTLIVFLVVFSHQAKQQAEQQANVDALEASLMVDKSNDLSTKVEDAEWTVEQLQVGRNLMQNEIAKVQEELAHLEDHTRRLMEQLDRLKNEWETLNKVKTDAPEISKLEEKLSALREEIEDSEKKIAAKKKKLEDNETIYAILPDEWKNGTRRRPLYVECLADRVILQPEGITLRVEDFEVDAGTKNPLAIALRAAREHMLKRSEAGLEAADPYPLLIVRPSGISSYYVARRAMHWEGRSGYILAGENARPEYPPRDPQLAKVLNQAVETGRRIQKQVRLHASNNTHGYTPGQAYSATGVSRGAPVGPSSRRYRPSARSAHSRQGSGYAPGGQGGGQSFGQIAGIDDSPLHQGNSQGGSSNRADRNGSATGPGIYANSGRGPGRQGYSTARSGSAARGVRGGTGQGTAAQGSRGAGSAGATSSGMNATAGGSGGSSSTMNGYSAGQPTAGVAMVSDDGHTSSPSEGSQSSASARGGSSRSAAGRPGGESCASGGCPISNSQAKQALKRQQASGEDWALRFKNTGAVPFSRFLQVACRNDRIVIGAERGIDFRREIPMQDEPAAAIYHLIQIVHERTERWGMAGDGMFWRPILEVKIEPGGERNFVQLSQMLRGSGIRIEPLQANRTQPKIR